MPALLTASQLVSVRHGRPLLPLEHLSAQGVLVWPHLLKPGSQLCPFMPCLSELSDAAIKRMAGNSMHLAVAVRVVGFMLATSSKVALQKGYTCTLDCSQDSEDLLSDRA
eukprot:11905620-Alexandrium_andersonii.AAC.1